MKIEKVYERKGKRNHIRRYYAETEKTCWYASVINGEIVNAAIRADKVEGFDKGIDPKELPPEMLAFMNKTKKEKE